MDAGALFFIPCAIFPARTKSSQPLGFGGMGVGIAMFGGLLLTLKTMTNAIRQATRPTSVKPQQLSAPRERLRRLRGAVSSGIRLRLLQTIGMRTVCFTQLTGRDYYLLSKEECLLFRGSIQKPAREESEDG